MADADAFRALYREHYGRVHAYLARRVEAGAVEDLVAETFLVAWRRQAEMPAHVLPWLLNTAGKLLANQRRTDGRRAPLLPPADGGSVEADAERRAQRRALATALASLDEADRELLLLRHWDGMAPRDIATVVELNPVATRARLHRATRRLQDALAEALEREPALGFELRGEPHVT